MADRKKSNYCLHGRKSNRCSILFGIYALISSAAFVNDAQSQSFSAEIKEEAPSSDCASFNHSALPPEVFLPGTKLRYFCTPSVSFIRLVGPNGCPDDLCVTAIVGNCSAQNCPFSLFIAKPYALIHDLRQLPGFFSAGIAISEHDYLNVIVGPRAVIVTGNLTKH